MYTLVKPQFYYIKVGFKGVILHAYRRVFMMDDILFIFPRKLTLTFHGNCLPRRQYLHEMSKSIICEK